MLPVAHELPVSVQGGVNGVIQLPTLIGQLVQDVLIPIGVAKLHQQDDRYDEGNQRQGGKDENGEDHGYASVHVLKTVYHMRAGPAQGFSKKKTCRIGRLM